MTEHGVSLPPPSLKPGEPIHVRFARIFVRAVRLYKTKHSPPGPCRFLRDTPAQLVLFEGSGPTRRARGSVAKVRMPAIAPRALKKSRPRPSGSERARQLTGAEPPDGVTPARIWRSITAARIIPTTSAIAVRVSW